MASLHYLSSCFTVPCKPKTVSTNSSTLLTSDSIFSSLSFRRNLSENVAMQQGGFSTWGIKTVPRRSVVCEAGTTKKPDSAEKRARQAEKRRLRNKARKSEIKTRMRKVFEALEALKKKSEAQAEEIVPIEKLIAEAYSAIDKAVQKGTLHRNTGNHRKSRLARMKRTIEIQRGWYTPVSAA